MVTEQELLDMFDLDELDDKKHKCVVVLYTTASGFLRGLVDDLKAGGHPADGRVLSVGLPIVDTELTLADMLWYSSRWSSIRSIEPNREINV